MNGGLSPRVQAAIDRVDRAEFVPDEYRREAGVDAPLPIGFGQTISQPTLVAWMTEQLGVQPEHRVLEIGTGSGYQTALLAELGASVWSIERVPELAAWAQERLTRLGYSRVHLRTGDGYTGWPEASPFDRIILTAAPPSVPQTLVDQLADGGRLLAPVGANDQMILIGDKTAGTMHWRETIGVRFVPMV